MRLKLPSSLAALTVVASVAAACVLAPPARAQQQQKAPAPPPKGVKVERDIPYVPDGDPSQKLDVYLPEQPGDKPLPLVVWVHGGGWRGGSKAGCPAVTLVPHGYAAASVGYRFSQKAKFPAQIQDCQAAVRFLRANAKRFNIDPDRVGVWGGSAGGHLVSLLGTAGGTDAFPKIGGNDGQSDRVQCVVDVYGPADFTLVKSQAAADAGVKYVYDFNQLDGNPYAMLIGAKLGDDPAKERAVSPVTYVSGDDPPVLIHHGTRDPHVPYAQSVAFADALRKAGVAVTLQPFPGAGHGGSVFGIPLVREQTRLFFDKHLKGADVKVEPIPDSALTPPTTAPAAAR